MSSKRGRPAGAKNIKSVVDVEPSRCIRCGSSRRSKYFNTQRREFRGGSKFVAIVYRRCKCLDCGQQRVDRQPVYAPEEKIIA